MITRRDIMNALGDQTEDKFLTGLFVGIGVGALIGSAVALLVSPRSGSDLRQMIGEKVGSLKQKARDTASEIQQ